ncbi:ATP-binding protein [Clostridium sp. D53t1_180928_C8]|uniref:sensor histidine kinase n=1 Tax=Clostridium sp. D53t1_180928_C8 TaxID=2787101 RepID=UPI001FAC0A9A|nr:ATP-binding protein [Clostridium sp. D53t1_180928_C8]
MRLINNIIDIQNIGGENEFKLININIVELIEELVTSIIPYLESKNLSLVFDTNKEDVMMKVDVDKFERIILNLLSNAIKFSKENGEIRITLKFEEYFYIIIEDEGVGINNEDINSIFEKFVQLDNSLCRKNEGSGIGLAIVKSFVELHNGKIYVDSIVNIGSRFVLKFPIVKEEYQNNNTFNKNKVKECVEMELSDIYL